MKQLNLNKPLQTKEGRLIRLLCSDRESPSGLHCIGLVDLLDREEVLIFDKFGRLMQGGSVEVINAPVVRTFTCPLYISTPSDQEPQSSYISVGGTTNYCDKKKNLYADGFLVVRTENGKVVSCSFEN